MDLEKYKKAFNVELPVSDSMDDYIDFILAHIRPMSEDMREEEYWLGRRWIEIRDSLTFHESVLHIFKPGGEYLIIVDGNISQGAWGQLDHPNSMTIQHGARHELYDMAFLNEDFFIIKKHGDQKRKGQSKYFVLGAESSVRGLEWRDCMELMFNVYRNNSRWGSYLTAIVVILAVILILSIL